MNRKVTSSSPRIASRLPVLVALALGGCTLFDTRPAVEILPGGDLVGGFTMQLRVEAGGAPQARILIDGKALGELIPTGVDVRVDTSTVPEGVHELVVRVEQAPAPRTSAPRRLEIRKFGYRVPVEIAQKSGPWDPVVFEVRSPEPMATVTASARGTSAAVALPCDPPVPSADRRTWTVTVGGGTLKELGSLSVSAEVTNDMGLPGTAQARFTMPTRIAVTFQQPSGEVSFPIRVVASTPVRVPSATLIAKPVGGVAFAVRELGPSPWDLTLTRDDLSPGAYTLEVRRDDIQLEGSASVLVAGTSAITSCSVQGGAATVTPDRCGLVTYQVIPAQVALAATAFGEPLPGDLIVSRISDATWSLCPSASRWKRGPVPFLAKLAAFDAGGAVVDRTSCVFTLGWDWATPGADPITDGTEALRGGVLALHAVVPQTVRIAVVGLPGSTYAGSVRIASKDPAPGAFRLGPALNDAPAAEAVASLGADDGILWTRPAGPGLADVLLATAPGLDWTTTTLTEGAAPGARSPAMGADMYGPRIAAWVEERAEGGSVIRVHWEPMGWQPLPPITSWTAGGRVEAPSVTRSGPAGDSAHVAFLDVWPDGTQRARVLGWTRSGWTELYFATEPAFGPRASDAATVHLAADSSSARLYLRSRTQGVRAFDWIPDPADPRWQQGSSPLGPPTGVPGTDPFVCGMPADGRRAVAVLGFTRPDGQAEIRVCPTASGGDCASLGPMPGAPPTSLVVDPNTLTVAWTASDGTIHLRTLTP